MRQTILTDKNLGKLVLVPQSSGPLLARLPLKEHNQVFAQEFDFWTGGQEFKNARIDIGLSQIRLHRPQPTLALP